MWQACEDHTTCGVHRDLEPDRTGSLLQRTDRATVSTNALPSVDMIGPLQLLMEQAVNWLPTVPHTVDTPCGTFDGCSVDFEKVRCRGAVLFSAAIAHVSALVRRVPSATWQMAGGGCTNRTCRGSFRARLPPGRPAIGPRQAFASMCAVLCRRS